MTAQGNCLEIGEKIKEMRSKLLKNKKKLKCEIGKKIRKHSEHFEAKKNIAAQRTTLKLEKKSEQIYNFLQIKNK